MAGCVLELNSSATRDAGAMTDNLIDIAFLLTKWSILKNTTITLKQRTCTILVTVSDRFIWRFVFSLYFISTAKFSIGFDDETLLKVLFLNKKKRIQ